ncbi:hypothetical protein APY03_3192 [Variovorax sp. WDL1]|nr:hypothetical protein APY03_3192 [Variovorax sp. WDL1]
MLAERRKQRALKAAFSLIEARVHDGSKRSFDVGNQGVVVQSFILL